MSSRSIVVVWMLALVVLIGGVDLVAADENVGNTTAVASLAAVGGSTGWGRLTVIDEQDQSGLDRSVTAVIYGLAPATAYDVVVDSVSLGTVQSDAGGAGQLILVSPSNVLPPVPAALPPAASLVSAEVYDSSLALVLVGQFSISHSGAASYQESITLADVAGGTASGAAHVERDAGDQPSQSFETDAIGLAADQQYQVMVDGFLAGLATADATGYARLYLEAPFGDNLLPPQLQPIERLRLVEWADGSGATLLSGSFSGVPTTGDDEDGSEDGSDDEPGSVEGQITAFTVDGFTMAAGPTTVRVVVTPQTVFDGFTSLADLVIGDTVEVEGTAPPNGGPVTASLIQKCTLIGTDVVCGDDSGDHGGSDGDGGDDHDDGGGHEG